MRSTAVVPENVSVIRANNGKKVYVGMEDKIEVNLGTPHTTCETDNFLTVAVQDPVGKHLVKNTAIKLTIL